MTKKKRKKSIQVFDETIEKFERLVEQKKKPDWNALYCPLCDYYFCSDCPLGQFEPSGAYGCFNIARKLRITDNSYEILQMLYQVRIYLYGEKGVLIK
jgi:hypothetical protein